MFVTFYSYKGGVGRSMALANVACLLAEHRDHPQRVLLWDFDLEAPGLHKLFPPVEPFRRGFVDLAFEFAQHGRMPDPGEFVYQSAIEGVDILPAGRVNESYCAHLEKIDWLGFFGDDPLDRGRFFGELMLWMREAPRNYDYVLIDSRTGLNDVAGICTEILPDLVLFIFRLTDQNLDGVEHLVPAIRSQLNGRGKTDVKIFPVASVVLSQSSEDLNARRARASSSFGTKSLSYIRFDPDLISDEKLFCQHDVISSMWPLPPIVDDYKRLCASIRRLNEEDTLTSAKLLNRAMRAHDYATARRAIEPLLKGRPTLGSTWRHLRRLCNEIREGKKWADKMVEELLTTTRDNVFVLEWMASKCAAESVASDGNDLMQARDYLKRAVAIEPNRARLHRKMAEVESAAGDLEAAETALKECHRLTPDNVQVLVNLANLYVRMGQDHFIDALKVLDDRDDDHLEPLAIYLWTYLGNQDNARRVFEQCLENSPRFLGDWHYGQLVNAHCLLIEGNSKSALETAKECIDSESHVPDESAIVNWAEFYLCAEQFDAVEELLRSKGVIEPDEHRGLCALADYLSGKPEASEAEVIEAWEQRPWSFTELLFFRERVRRLSAGRYGDRLAVIEKLIRKHTYNEGSVFWRLPSHGFYRLSFRGVMPAGLKTNS